MSGGCRAGADQKMCLAEEELSEMREKLQALGESEMASYGPPPRKSRMLAV